MTGPESAGCATVDSEPAGNGMPTRRMYVALKGLARDR